MFSRDGTPIIHCGALVIYHPSANSATDLQVVVIATEANQWWTELSSQPEAQS